MQQEIKQGSVHGFTDYCRKVAAEGAVLLKNQDQTLPLCAKDSVSLFGRIQFDLYRSGTGSGGSVNVEYKTNLIDGLRSKTNIVLNEDLATVYEQWIKDHPYDDGGTGWATEPWFQQEMPISAELVQRSSTHSNKAIVVIGRTAGEDQDNSDAPGSYQLTAEEADLLTTVGAGFDNVIVVLNTSNFIDMSWLEGQPFSKNIKSVIYIWQGGMEGGNAAADVLVGDVTPSGKLTDTIAKSINDYPSTENYNGKDNNLYQEDIYVGYRFFETFCPEKVQFEFGFGLSYSQFSITPSAGRVVSNVDEDQISFNVTVTNTGTQYSGKEVVQLYFEAPQGELGKPAKALGGFTKTSNLKPGSSETLTVSLPIERMASYDDSGVTGYANAYVLEAGAYRFYIGNSVKNNQLVHIGEDAQWTVDHTTVIEQLEEAMAPIEDFTRMKPGVQQENGLYAVEFEPTPKRKISLAQRIENRMPEVIVQTGDQGYKLKDVIVERVSMENFIAQLDDDDLATIVRGEGMSSTWVTPGTASAFGGVSKKLFDLGIPIGCTADGPSGIRMDGGGTATQMPIGTLLAATWNTAMVEELYSFEGQELINYQIDTLLGPGLNIRRSPLNGRNFEYFSEDPLVTGAFSVATVQGIMKHGSNATLKHFACNNQEENRTLVDAVVSERALREIYLKGFEMAVKDGGANSIMTAYNPVNGHWAASNYDLNTTILRKEWGFKGMVMTDWWAKMNDTAHGGEATTNFTNHMVRAQNDIYMVVNNFGAETNANNDNTEASLKDGTVNRAELQRSAMNICYFLTQSPVISREQTFSEQVRLFLADVTLANESLIDISADEQLPIAMAGDTLFQVSKAGTYQLTTEVMSLESNQAQTECNLMLNGAVMALIQTNGTDGQWIPKKLVKAQLEQGYYKLNLDFIRAGMQLNRIKFNKL